MSDFEKDKNADNLKNSTEIKDIQYTDKRTEKKIEIVKPNRKEENIEPEKENIKTEDILDDLEFISEETVKDKSKMAEGKPISHELVSRKKTVRRSVDELEAKKEKSLALVKKNIILIGIVCVVIIVAVCALVIWGKKQKSKKAEENKAQPISAQEYEKDEHQEINELIENYYTAYAAGDTDTILQYATPMTDKEKSYISAYSQYVESFENIVCYTKTGADDTSYIVSVAFELKYKDVETTAPGLDFFYVRTADNGEVYIDNVYSPFNLLYQENALDDTIRQLIESYQTGEDVVALQAGVQTQYDAALEKDENLKKMVEETVTNAIAEWSAGQDAQQQQKEEEAAQQVAQEEQQEEETPQETGTEGDTGDTGETEQKAWVYATDGIKIREKASEDSAVLASVTKGSELRQLAVTENGWSKVKTGDIVGYAKTEYLSSEKSTGGTSAGSLDEGDRIYLTETVNVRKSMSESADRVGVAYAGDTVTVIMSYEEGWTKVEWNGKTGYIKTDILSGM